MPRGTDRYDEAQIQQRLWTPQVLRSQGIMAAWWDASALDYITVATGVNPWKDRLGVRDASHSSGGNQAAFNVQGWLPGTVNMPTLAPDGSNDHYNTLGSDISYSASPGLFAVTVCTNSGAAATRVLFSGNAGAPEYSIRSGNKVCITRCGQSDLFTSTGTIPTGAAMVGMEATTSISRVWLNGTSEENSTNPAFSQPINCLFFQRPSGVQYFDGRVAEMIVCSTTLAAYRRQPLEGYLAWKWRLVDRLPASHPYKQRPPLL